MNPVGRALEDQTESFSGFLQVRAEIFISTENAKSYQVSLSILIRILIRGIKRIIRRFILNICVKRSY
jgi:hypothetical protein